MHVAQHPMSASAPAPVPSPARPTPPSPVARVRPPQCGSSRGSREAPRLWSGAGAWALAPAARRTDCRQLGKAWLAGAHGSARERQRSRTGAACGAGPATPAPPAAGSAGPGLVLARRSWTAPGAGGRSAGAAAGPGRRLTQSGRVGVALGPQRRLPTASGALLGAGSWVLRSWRPSPWRRRPCAWALCPGAPFRSRGGS